MLDQVLQHIDRELPASLDRLFALLRLESVSTDPAYAEACRSAAAWLAADLAGIGFEAAVRPTAGHPMVVGHDRRSGGPHALFYGHYDVQPVDPLDLWRTPPFEPRLETGADGEKRIVARGASDDKGQLMTFVEACRAWQAVAGALPVQVSVLLEGEEECGSTNLVPFLEANRQELAADLAMICDTSMWRPGHPAVTTMLRGLVGEEVTVTAADRDLHSGMYGAAARNPIHVLVAILAGLHDAAGGVALPGFYDGVPEVEPDLRRAWEALGFDAADFLGAIGLSEAAGEAGRSVLEQVWSRPTCEVNGVSGGYAGQGIKTVIPSTASAKVTFRLVGDQDPDAVRQGFRQFVRERLPADCRADFVAYGGSPAVRLPHDGPGVLRARRALADEWGVAPALVGSGGSIPVAGDFQRVLGVDSLMIGFALDDDRIHSPNEKYDLASFHRGIRSWARILAALAEPDGPA